MTGAPKLAAVELLEEIEHLHVGAPAGATEHSQCGVGYRLSALGVELAGGLARQSLDGVDQRPVELDDPILRPLEIAPDVGERRAELVCDIARQASTLTVVLRDVVGHLVLAAL